MQYTRQQLEECLKKAWSYENRAGHDAENYATSFIGTVRRGNRLYDLYEDTNHSYWYKCRVMTKQGIVSEYEAVFGHPERKYARREKYGNYCSNVTKGRNRKNNHVRFNSIHIR